MRRSISWRASTAFEAFSSGSPRVCTERSSSRLTSAENLARLMTSLGLALRQTSSNLHQRCNCRQWADACAMPTAPAHALLHPGPPPVSAHWSSQQAEETQNDLCQWQGQSLLRILSCGFCLDAPSDWVWRVVGVEQGRSYLECYVLSLSVTVKPQHQPLALPGLLLEVPLDRLLVLEREPSTTVQSSLFSYRSGCKDLS